MEDPAPGAHRSNCCCFTMTALAWLRSALSLDNAYRNTSCKPSDPAQKLTSLNPPPNHPAQAQVLYYILPHKALLRRLAAVPQNV